MQYGPTVERVVYAGHQVPAKEERMHDPTIDDADCLFLLSTNCVVGVELPQRLYAYEPSNNVIVTS